MSKFPHCPPITWYLFQHVGRLHRVCMFRVKIVFAALLHVHTYVPELEKNSVRSVSHVRERKKQQKMRVVKIKRRQAPCVLLRPSPSTAASLPIADHRRRREEPGNNRRVRESGRDVGVLYNGQRAAQGVQAREFPSAQAKEENLSARYTKKAITNSDRYTYCPVSLLNSGLILQLYTDGRQHRVSPTRSCHRSDHLLRAASVGFRRLEGERSGVRCSLASVISMSLSGITFQHAHSFWDEQPRSGAAILNGPGQRCCGSRAGRSNQALAAIAYNAPRRNRRVRPSAEPGHQRRHVQEPRRHQGAVRGVLPGWLLRHGGVLRLGGPNVFARHGGFSASGARE